MMRTKYLGVAMLVMLATATTVGDLGRGPA